MGLRPKKNNYGGKAGSQRQGEATAQGQFRRNFDGGQVEIASAKKQPPLMSLQAGQPMQGTVGDRQLADLIIGKLISH